MLYTLFTLTSLLTALHALTITFPSSGTSVDPSGPITITWTSTSSDPSTIKLNFVNNGVSQTLESNVQTSSGSYTVPANTIVTYGAGFTITASTSSGDNVATSGSFILAYGGTVVTSNGQASLVTTGTGNNYSPTSLIFSTLSLDGQSVTATYLPGSTTTAGATGSGTTGTANATSSRAFTTHGIQSFTSTLSDTASSSSSSSSTHASSSASSSASAASTTANAQPRIAVGKEVMSVAGFLAGLVALVA